MVAASVQATFGDFGKCVWNLLDQPKRCVDVGFECFQIPVVHSYQVNVVCKATV